MGDTVFEKQLQNANELETEQRDSARDIWMKNYSEQIFSTDNIEVKTDINLKQIMALNKGLLFAERFRSKLMLGLCNGIMVLSVSKDRKSRKEFTDVTKSINANDTDDIPTLKDRLLG